VEFRSRILKKDGRTLQLSHKWTKMHTCILISFVMVLANKILLHSKFKIEHHAAQKLTGWIHQLYKDSHSSSPTGIRRETVRHKYNVTCKMHPVVIFDWIVDHYYLNVHRDVSRIAWVDRDVGCVVDWLYYGPFL
jgi:hypothetical protein